MANLKSSKKDVRRIEKRTSINRAAKSKVRTFLKKAILAVANKSSDMKEAIISFESIGMKAARKGVFSQKSISRKVSRLVQKMQKLA
jgi:small subunit ribosomal protein S20